MKNEILMSKSFELASAIIDICKEINKTEWKVISHQLLKCGTSVGANIRESVYAESKNDFIHKISISRKEASECKYWLDLILHKNIYEVDSKVLDILNHIQKVITILINASRKR